MTEAEFRELQRKQRESGMRLMAYLKRESISRSCYYYWRRKFNGSNCVKNVMAPISVRRYNPENEMYASYKTKR